MTKLSAVFILAALTIACLGEDTVQDPVNIRLIKAAYSKDTQEIQKISHQLLSKENSKAFFEGIRRKLGRNFANLFREFKSSIQLYLESNGHDLEVIESEIRNLQGGSREAVGNLNEIVGEEVLYIKEDHVKVSYDILEKICINVVNRILEDKFNNNFYVQVTVRRSLREFLTLYRPILRNIMENQSIPFHVRNRRSLVTLEIFDQIIEETAKITLEIILQLYHNDIADSVNPLQEAVLKGYDDITKLLRGLYKDGQPKYDLESIINRVVNLLVERLQQILDDTVQTLDLIFEDIKWGNIDELFNILKNIFRQEEKALRQLTLNDGNGDNGDIDPSAPEDGDVSLMDWIWAQISKTINMLLKMYIKGVVKLAANPVGSLILGPVEGLLYYIIDSVFPLGIQLN